VKSLLTKTVNSQIYLIFVGAFCP